MQILTNMKKNSEIWTRVHRTRVRIKRIPSVEKELNQLNRYYDSNIHMSLHIHPTEHLTFLIIMFSSELFRA